MADRIGRHVAPARIRTWLLTALGGVAFLIGPIESGVAQRGARINGGVRTWFEARV